MASIHGVVGSSKIVSGGFACQPWSQLGDGRGASDPRASSLVGILEAAYWWRAHSFPPGVRLQCRSRFGCETSDQGVLSADRFLPVRGAFGTCMPVKLISGLCG